MGQFFRLLKHPDQCTVQGEDFLPYLEELLAYHPGLEFLEGTPDFQKKYARTVVARILYSVNKSGTGEITEAELRKSRLLVTCHIVDAEADVNQVRDFFSYEHFYVLYCKFWELDSDHDFYLTRSDLLSYGGHALTKLIVNRIFSEIPRKFVSKRPGMMSYEDFIYFFLSEQDKTNYVSLKYWFNCVDLDGDGVIRPWEMKLFYDQQLERMQAYSHEVVPFKDILCQMHDCLVSLLYLSSINHLIHHDKVPKNEAAIVLSDFLHKHRIKMSGVFFNVLFNLNKVSAHRANKPHRFLQFIEYEQRDPFIHRQQREQPQVTSWYNLHHHILLSS